MAVERTLSIIKPDAVGKNVIGKIIQRFEEAGLTVVAARYTHLTQAEAEGFYAVHRERGFFGDLIKFMISGPVLVLVLEGENAVAKHREILGATDPKKAAPGTIRADFADSIDENAGHGSDSLENAANEIAVEAFLKGRIGFCDISRTVEDALGQADAPVPQSVQHVIRLDREARQRASALVAESCH